MRRRALTVVALLTTFSFPGFATAAAATEPRRREWTVDGVRREALVYAPPAAASTQWFDGKPPATAPAAASTTAATRPSGVPLVFVFHGHGGTARHAAAAYRFHAAWPEAVVVYMQGLNTPGRLSDPEGKKPGWQHGRGEQGDRDLKFFDAALASLRAEYHVDDRRVYCTGHSNGGQFTYLLWAARGDAFAAVAPSSAVAFADVKDLKPKPVFHVAGRRDALVKFAWQERMLAAVREANGCEAEGKPDGIGVTTYPSPRGAPVTTYVHDGGHQPPADMATAIVRFFKAHPPAPE